MPSKPRLLAFVLLAGALGIGIGLATGILDDEAGTQPAIEAEPAAPPAGAPEQSPGPVKDRRGPEAPISHDDEPDASAGPSGPPPETSEEFAAAATMRRYVAGLRRKDGRAVCRLLTPGAIATLDFPEERGSCPRSLEASLGFRDRRGYPVWKRSEITEAISAEVSGETARVVATVVTIYADVREQTVEDDIVYLVAAGAGWRITKPSATILRAIGIADFPPSVLAPPR